MTNFEKFKAEFAEQLPLITAITKSQSEVSKAEGWTTPEAALASVKAKLERDLTAEEIKKVVMNFTLSKMLYKADLEDATKKGEIVTLSEIKTIVS